MRPQYNQRGIFRDQRAELLTGRHRTHRTDEAVVVAAAEVVAEAAAETDAPGVGRGPRADGAGPVPVGLRIWEERRVDGRVVARAIDEREQLVVGGQAPIGVARKVLGRFTPVGVTNKPSTALSSISW